jgi:hypothetical protein
MTVTTTGRTVTNTRTATVEQQGEWKPRPFEPSWWQARQDRDALVGRLLGLFTNPGAGRTRDKTRRRGLSKLLDWLECQPGDRRSGQPVCTLPPSPQAGRARGTPLRLATGAAGSPAKRSRR